MSEQTVELAQAVAAILIQKNDLMLATAESCTGGLIAAACTDLAGSSAWPWTGKRFQSTDILY